MKGDVDMKTIQAYGYKVTGTENIITEIEEDLKDKNIIINWNNFENGNVLWDHNGDTKYSIEIDHVNKIVRLIEC